MARILFVDDDHSIQEMVQLMLKQSDHSVMAVGSAAEGLEAATSEDFDLIITDVMMPEMDGYEFTERLRADQRTANARIMILTARAQPIDYQSAIEAGANGYMAKPVTRAELAAKVDEMLAMKTGQPAAETVVQGYVVAVLGLRGGVGTTTIAVNMALGLIRNRIRTCLVDLSPASGHVALQLRLRPKSTWGDFATNGDPLDVGTMLLRHSSGLAVLAAPTRPVRAGFPPEAFDRTLAALNDLVSVTVVDSAPWLDQATYSALERAYITVLVVTPDVGSVQTLTNTLPVLAQAGVETDRIRVVLNHVSPAAGLPQAAVEKALGRPVDVVVPYAAAQSRALVQGQPLMITNPDDGFAAGINSLIAAL